MSGERVKSSETAAGASDGASGASLSRRVILATQLVFNIGFYAVVPFLAVHMADDLALSSQLIGVVLGVRTFCQQGLFFIGGLLAERLGSRWLLLAGCAVRFCGYAAFAFSASFSGMLLGACLTGAGGAMFSPCLEALAAEAERQTPAALRQHGIFALFAVCGEVGAVAGPLLGSALSGFGFRVMALACAMLFLIMMGVLYRSIPTHMALPERPVGWRGVMGNAPFLRFILCYSAYLFSYNQMYFGLPLELERVGGGAREMAGLFMLASVMVIVMQMPLAGWCRKQPPRLPLVAGFSLFAVAFACVALAALSPPSPPFNPADAGWLRFAPITAMVILLTLGQMLAVPTAMSLVPGYAGQGALPAYYGALASAGGCAVLLGNVLLGRMFDLAGASGAGIKLAVAAGGGDVGHAGRYALAWGVAALWPALAAAGFAGRFWKPPAV